MSVKPTLKELLRELRAKAADWEDIGIELEVDDGALKQIKTDNPGDSKSCLRELFRKWLSRADPQPKWPDIVEAVEGIGDEELATKNQRKILSLALHNFYTDCQLLILYYSCNITDTRTLGQTLDDLYQRVTGVIRMRTMSRPMMCTLYRQRPIEPSPDAVPV